MVVIVDSPVIDGWEKQPTISKGCATAAVRRNRHFQPWGSAAERALNVMLGQDVLS
jgi:hypothetical protein